MLPRHALRLGRCTDPAAAGGARYGHSVGSLRTPRQRPAGTSPVTAVLLALVLLAVVSIGVIALVDPFASETVDRSGPAILRRMRALEEFTAAEATFTQDVDLEEDTPWVPDFLKGERVVAIVTGSVRGVVDFSELDERSIVVDDDRTTIRVRLPEPVLSDVDIEESSSRIVARERGIVDRLGDVLAANPTDDAPVFQAAEDKLAQQAQDSEVLEEARDNTERWLRVFLGAAGFETVEIDWQEDAPA